MDCTILAAFLALLLRLSAHRLLAYPRVLSRLLLGQVGLLVLATILPAAVVLWSGAPSNTETALIAVSTLQLLMITSFLMYRRELLLLETKDFYVEDKKDARQFETPAEPRRVSFESTAVASEKRLPPPTALPPPKAAVAGAPESAPRFVYRPPGSARNLL